MKKAQRSSFKLHPLAAAIAIAMTAQFTSNVAYAGSGFGKGIDTTNYPVNIPTFYANSPVGPVPALNTFGSTTINPRTGLPVTVDTGKALRKFVDTLPGFGSAKANNLGQYIPVAVPEKWVDLNGAATADDYYEIAAIEFSEKMHSDLPKATRLRGYVQLSTATNPGLHIALRYPNGSPILDVNGMQVFAYDNPHHLGPVINATKGTAVRIKFTNYLPVGSELFLPVDSTVVGAGLGPDGVNQYTHNRAMIHLVGGHNPWISAGTPHQWIAPAGEVNAYATGMGKGVSTNNVPDMADPGNGSTTLYFPTDVSARFTFYQDRSSGITRLNSYAGMEAGYVVTDPTEQDLIARAVIPGAADTIPLIIEDKTFVPNNISQQDAKWDTAFWGQPGDLWFPHVYETNQDPNSIDGWSPTGRWDFGPLYWPIFPVHAPLPTGVHGDASLVLEAFFDTPLINGTAYPTLTVDPKAYRFRILNASNDRYLNLSLFKADPTVVAPQLDRNGNPIVDANGVQQFFTNTEVKMVPAVADAAGNPANWDANVVFNGVQGNQLPLPQYPQLKTNINVASSGPARAWPKDQRVGGAPDPTTTGPDFIVIGNDGGFLPNAVDVPAQPVTYELNRRSITVGNIYGYGLLLGAAERVDTIVDFSAYAGQTLILYNDAPTQNPWMDSRNDYYTGSQDMTDKGGSYSTQPGYGPNTRTMMQIKVNAAAPGVVPTPYNATALVTELPAAYAASQPQPLIPATAYNTAFGTNNPDVYVHVATGTQAQPTLDFSTSAAGGITLTGLTLVTSGGTVGAGGVILGNAIPGSGTGYDPLNPPTVIINNTVNGVSCLAPGGVSASAQAVVNATTRQVTDIINFNAGSGYTCAPTITFGTVTGVGAQATVNSSSMISYPVISKAEQELFDAYGRYNFTGGMELPMTNAVVQTTVPLNYIDSPTEIIGDNEIQVWKIVDNGFWANPIQFEGLEMQLVNRVGWDGTIKPPASTELGWKDTVTLNQLEDVVVAVRAKRASVPFGLPQSKRTQDPTLPLGVTSMSVTGASPLRFIPVPGVALTPGTMAAAALPPGSLALSTLGLPGHGLLTTAVNTNVVNGSPTGNYDNEFAWGSVSLGHRENDFIRPVVFNPTVIIPNAPTNLAMAAGTTILTWTDPTPAAAATTLANPQNEIGFKILKADLDANGNAGVFTEVGAVRANVTSWIEPAPAPNQTYELVAFNAAGDSVPSLSYAAAPPSVPAGLNVVQPLLFNSVSLTWAPLANTSRIELWRNGVLLTSNLLGSATSYTDTTVTAVQNYTYQLKAVNAFGTTTSADLLVTTPMEFVAAPTGLVAAPTATGTSVQLSWTDVANNETEYWVDMTVNGVTTRTVIARTAAQRTAINNLVQPARFVTAPGNNYTFVVTAVNVTGGAVSTSAPVSATVTMAATAPAAPTGLGVALTRANRATLTWMDNANSETSYLVTISNITTGVTTSARVNRNAAQSLATGLPLVTYNAVVALGNSYTFSVVAETARFGATAISAAAGPVSLDVAVPAAPAAVNAVVGAPGSRAVTVTWADVPVNATSYTVERATITAGVPGGWGRVARNVLPGVQTFLNTGLRAGRSYQYRVIAVGGAGSSQPATSAIVVAQ